MGRRRLIGKVRNGKVCCIRCNRVLPVEAFHKSKTSLTGYRHYCKECTKEQRRTKYRVWKCKGNVFRGKKVVPADAPTKIKAAKLGFDLRYWIDSHMKGEFHCLKCGDVFVRTTNYFLKVIRTCPGCGDTKRWTRLTPNGAARRIAKYGFKMDAADYTKAGALTTFECLNCGKTYRGRPDKIISGKHTPCSCKDEKQGYVKRKQIHLTKVQIQEELAKMGLKCLEPAKYKASSFHDTQCLTCGHIWKEKFHYLQRRSYKCINPDCTSPTSKPKPMNPNRPNMKLTEAEELRRIDEGIRKMNESWDGKYFWERDSVEQFNLLENIQKAMAEHAS